MSQREKKNVYSILQKKTTRLALRSYKAKKVKHIFGELSSGDNKFLRVSRKETSSFDNRWINEIEKAIPDIEYIVLNPRKITKTVGVVSPVEMVKKINNESVRHLASHTQFIKEIDEKGEVVPSKLLSIESDDDYAIYENRFVASLIRRLILFVEKRYEFLSENAPLKNTDEMKLSSTAVVNGALVEIETKVKVTRQSDDDGITKDAAFMQRLLEVRNHLRFCYTSEFMKLVKTEKDVKNPIILTNILRKNPKYHRCYQLWKFIERYNAAGINYSVEDTYSTFTAGQIEEANALLMASFLACKPGVISKKPYQKIKHSRPKILRSIDDEEFEYGPYLKGPIEFVRVDEAYRKATEETNKFYRSKNILESDSGKDEKKRIINLQKKEEEAFIADKRFENIQIGLMSDAKNALMSRKKKELAAFEKKAKKIREKALAAEQARLEQRKKRARMEKEALIKAARKKLSDSGKLDAVMVVNENGKEEKE